jgi:hypothetical protein
VKFLLDRLQRMRSTKGDDTSIPIIVLPDDHSLLSSLSLAHLQTLHQTEDSPKYKQPKRLRYPCATYSQPFLRLLLLLPLRQLKTLAPSLPCQHQHLQTQLLVVPPVNAAEEGIKEGGGESRGGGTKGGDIIGSDTLVASARLENGTAEDLGESEGVLCAGRRKDGKSSERSGRWERGWRMRARRCT